MSAPTTDEQRAGVRLAEGSSATELFHGVVRDTVAAFPDVFGSLKVPDSAIAFKRSYPELLPRLEATRLASARRSEVAARAVDHARRCFVVGPDATPLLDAVAASADAFECDVHRFGGVPGLVPSVPVAGRDLRHDELVDEVDAMVDQGSASPAVADAVRRLVALDGGIDLTGRRIAVFGAGAELAPTRAWLAGGADVLWLDLADPPSELLDDESLAGSLRWVPGGVDLLLEPARVRATIEEFCAGSAVDLGLYAYAPGRAREWRLTATMNAIVDALPAASVASVAMLVSPTTCGSLTATEREWEHARRSGRPRWQSVVAAMRLLGSGDGHAAAGEAAANRGIVAIQGASYQAAQYLGKILSAEAWASADLPRRVSANTAGVSLTESLQHPVFDLAFAGAAALGVETYEPATTAALNGLLTLDDRLHGGSTSGVDELFGTRVHGGIYALPYPIEPALRVAAALGALRHPRRVMSLVRRR
ncbi:MAG: hypothetical protein AAF945_00035 [Actinomycetota bacterium]